MDDPFTSYRTEPASFEFTGGESYTGGSEELCYLGVDEASSTPTSMELESDCELIASTASRIGGYPTLLLDTREISSVVLQGTGDLEFNCPEQLVSTRRALMPLSNELRRGHLVAPRLW